MYIVLKRTEESEEVLNILFGENDEEVQSWISEYLAEQIENLKLIQLEEGIKNMNYIINEDSSKNQFSLVKNYKKIHKGYVYNTSEKIGKVMYTINYVEYDGRNINYSEQKSTFKRDLNNEINNRVLRQLDKESLYQVLRSIQNKMLLKESWDSFEFTNMISETIRTFKKQLYSNIAKKLKRFGQYKKNKTNLLSDFSVGACGLEAKKKMQ
jgi:hypothetical protein